MILLSSPPTASQILERIVGAHSRLTSFEARVEHPLPPGAKGRIPAQLVGRRGDGMKLRVLDTGASPLPTLRTFAVSGASGYSYDDLLNEYVPAKRSGGTPYARLSAIVGSADVAVALLLEPTSTATFLRELGKVKGWTVKPGELTLREKGTVTVVGYDPRTSLLTHIRAGKGRESFEARYVYASNGLNAWAPPADARRVPFGSSLAGMISFRDAAARKVGERLIRRSARISSGHIVISGDHPATVDAVNGALRQRGSKLESVYAGGVLTVKNLRNGNIVRGKANASDVRRITAKLGEPLVPVAQALLSRRMPFTNLFVPARQARVRGKVAVAGAPCDILLLTGNGATTSVFVDGSGRILSLLAEARDRRGEITELVEQKFAYGPAQAIQPPQGAAGPLPK